MNELNFCRHLFLTALHHYLFLKMLKNLKPLKNYVIKTIFFQWHNKLFDWSEKEDSMWTWDKNLTKVSQPT